MLYGVLTAMLPVASKAQSFACTNRQDAQTAPLRSPNGLTVVLQMHSENDHGKNTHLCQSDYTLQVSRADGAAEPPADFFGADDEWDRPLLFRIDGFSNDGNHAFLFLSEGAGKKAWIDAVDYDLLSSTWKEAYLRPPRDLGSWCAATLRIVETTPAGEMVLGTTLASGCSEQQKWRLKVDSGNGGTRPERPERLSSRIEVTDLNPGSHP